MADKLPFSAVQELPDGQYVFQLKNKSGEPVNITARNLTEAVEKNRQSATQENSPSGGIAPNPISAALNSLIDGATFGFAKYANGLESAAVPFAKYLMPSSETTFNDVKNAFNEGAETWNEAQKTNRDAYPSIYSVGSIAGSAAPIIGATLLTGGLAAPEAGAGALARIASVPAKAAVKAATTTGVKGVGARALLGVPAGAAVSALDATGHDEDPIPAAIIGGVLGSGASVLGDAARPLARVINGKIGKTTAQVAAQDLSNNYTKRALEKFNKVKENAKLTNEDLIAKLNEAKELSADQITLADLLGTNGQRSLSGLARSGEEPAEIISNALNSRQADQSRRLLNNFQQAAGTNVSAAQQKIINDAARQQLAAEEYKQASQEAPNIQLGPIRDYLDSQLAQFNDPVGQTTGIYRYLKKLRDDLETESPRVPFNSIQTVKGAIDDNINRALRNDQNYLASKLVGARDVINKTISDASPTYAKANANYRQSILNNEALEKGQKAATSGRIGDIINEYINLTPAEREAYKIGFTNKPVQDLERAGYGGDNSRKYLTGTTAQLYPKIYGEEAGGRLLKQLELEKLQNDTLNRALGGSRTADNLNDISQLGANVGHIALSAAQGNPVPLAVNGAVNLSRKVIDAITRFSPEDKVSLTNLLLQKPNNQTTKFLLDAVKNDKMTRENKILLQKYLTPLESASVGYTVGGGQ